MTTVPDERAVADALVCTDPVELGSILFTLVQPHVGHEVAYNRWYERDHLYAGCMIGPYNFAAGRFVATRDLKALRFPDPSPVVPSPDVGSFLAMYWVLRGHHREWSRWARRQVKALIDADRMFPHRDHVHTQLYEYAGVVHRDPDGVPPELALDRRFPGLAALIVRCDGDRPATMSRLATDVLPEALRGSAAAMCLSFTPFPMPPGQPSDVPSSDDDERRFLQLFFCDGDVAAAWDATFRPLAGAYAEAGAEVVFASPFIGTVPGTDTHVADI